MKQDLSGLQTKLSAWGKMQAAVSTLRDATKVLTQSSTWQASKAGSSDEASVMAVGGGTAAAGTYSLSVQSLAQRHSLASLTRFPAGDTAVITSGGSLEIQLGSVNAESLAFEPDLKRKATPVVIPAGATLAEIRSAINGANAGVSASILDDGDGKRLVLTSKETGKAQAFEITSGDAGLAEFAMSTDPLIGMARKQVAADSKLTINGLEITGKSNQLDGVIEGVTLTLKKVTTTPAEISVGGDQDATKANLEKFVTAYNDLNKLLSDQTRYDPGSKTAGALQ
ncbi:MAG TPA: flagellar filament capping protein FliD, partial [Rubrivivax sp.]|nr:flagellar filament capping protein FliD [Rubrivivax sp.]